MGNARARTLYEARAPVFFVRPKDYDLAMVRERWIRAKYEKKLFVKPQAEEDAAAAALASSVAEETTNGSSGSATSSDGAADGGSGRASAASAADASAAAAASPAASSSAAAAPAAASAALSPNDPACFIAPERALEGWLFKENKAKKWQKRWFLLWGRELHYFKDAGDSYEAGRIDVVHCKILIPDGSGSSAALVSASTGGSGGGGGGSGAPAGHRYFFELVSTQQDRAYPLAAESEEEMFLWIHAIRRAIIFYSAIAQGEEAKGMQARQADCKVPYGRLAHVSKKGTLSKQGGGWASWNKRYFVLANDTTTNNNAASSSSSSSSSSNGTASGSPVPTLYYYKNTPGDADLPEGGICLDGASIASGEDKLKKKLVFTLLTPDRTYFIQATSEAEMQDWMATLQNITDQAQKRRRVDFADPKLVG
jgi:hypothetical protein